MNGSSCASLHSRVFWRPGGRDFQNTRASAECCWCVAFARVTRRRIAGTSNFLITNLDPGIEYHSSEVWQIDFDPLYHGHDGYLEVWRDVLESFEDVRLDPKELLDLGDRFLVTIKLSGHGAGSGVSVSQPLFQVFTVRRGLIVRQDDFQDRAEALEAVGLSEQDPHADS